MKNGIQSGILAGNWLIQQERRNKTKREKEKAWVSESQQDSAEGERGDRGWTLLLFTMGNGESADFCGVTVSDSLAAWEEPNSFAPPDCWSKGFKDSEGALLDLQKPGLSANERPTILVRQKKLLKRGELY